MDTILKENLQRTESLYAFSHTWFLGSELRKRILEFVDPQAPIRILEIGSYEGISACFFSDELIGHPDSVLVCVDPFDMQDIHTTLTNDTERRFLENIDKSRNRQKIRVCRMTSDDYFRYAIEDDEMFDFVYIDGSHVPEQIVRDIQHAYQHVRIGGIIWLDDYNGNADIRNAIDTHLQSIQSNIDIIHVKYQFAFRKLN